MGGGGFFLEVSVLAKKKNGGNGETRRAGLSLGQVGKLTAIAEPWSMEKRGKCFVD